MAIVLALMIVGWLLAFALGAQAGFDGPSPAAKPAAAQTETVESASYRGPVSAA